jgi:hypothetical protein
LVRRGESIGNHTGGKDDGAVSSSSFFPRRSDSYFYAQIAARDAPGKPIEIWFEDEAPDRAEEQDQLR